MKIATYDLHGLSVNEATSRLFIILESFEESNESVIKIITGKGENILKNLVEDFLYKERRQFSKIKEGVFIVFRH